MIWNMGFRVQMSLCIHRSAEVLKSTLSHARQYLGYAVSQPCSWAANVAVSNAVESKPRLSKPFIGTNILLMVNLHLTVVLENMSFCLCWVFVSSSCTRGSEPYRRKKQIGQFVPNFVVEVREDPDSQECIISHNIVCQSILFFLFLHFLTAFWASASFCREMQLKGGRKDRSHRKAGVLQVMRFTLTWSNYFTLILFFITKF